MCNYQSHSRKKIKDKYPFINSELMTVLYSNEMPANWEKEKSFADNVRRFNDINLTEFYVDTRPDLNIIHCAAGYSGQFDMQAVLL